jgi:hypothetical protein
MKLMVSLLRDIVAKLCKWVRRRIKAVAEAGGDVFIRRNLHVPVQMLFKFSMNI